MKKVIHAAILLFTCLSAHANSSVVFNIPDAGVIEPNGGTLEINLSEKMRLNLRYNVKCVVVNSTKSNVIFGYSLHHDPTIFQASKVATPGKHTIRLNQIMVTNNGGAPYLRFINYDDTNAIQVQDCVGNIHISS